ncbi:U32 family peptidase [Paenibacillus athensensis]|uniref:Peptidase U32 n=1 Tax=Paenibacillus athensensis TaxID=1967502 RepID=A0A4Y8Q1K1_9BACL|nr:peptidase U32 family protein [Paenibacillus athensensis]MCD1258282.1 U32 family peptidase [Paenibacillus athensensis]
MRKPELLINAGSVSDIQRYIAAGADAVLVGEQRYGLRLPGDLTPEELAPAVAWAHGRGAKVYAAVNRIFDNASLPGLAAYIERLAAIGVDALVFGDPAVLTAVRQLESARRPKLHWNAEMTSTNYATANYWAGQGAARAVLARELNMEQVLEFKRKASVEAEVQVHGITNIYHSRRELVKSYLEHQGRRADGEDRSADRGLFLIEKERQDQRYPIFEDSAGTHIMSSEDICMLDALPELIDGGVDSFKIDGLLKSALYNETAIRSYRAAIDAYAADPAGYAFDPEWLAAIERLQDPERELTYGFFYKEQVY